MFWEKRTVANFEGVAGYIEVPSDTKQIVLDINENKYFKLVVDGRNMLPERNIDKLVRFASMSEDLPLIFKVKNDALRVDLNGINPDGLPLVRTVIEIEPRGNNYSEVYLLRSEFCAKELTPEEKLTKAFSELGKKIALQIHR